MKIYPYTLTLEKNCWSKDLSIAQTAKIVNPVQTAPTRSGSALFAVAVEIFDSKNKLVQI